MAAFPHVDYSACSDKGCKRGNNEDAVWQSGSRGVFCIADGMGGGDDGEVASKRTVDAVSEFMLAHAFPEGRAYSAAALGDALGKVMSRASTWVWKYAHERRLHGCGSTFVGLVLDATNPSQALALHAGDSRVYRLRGAEFKQITRDHSAAELIGAKSEEELNPMFRGMVLRAIGVQKTVELERTPLDVQAGDSLLLCSDGLYKMVSDRGIADILGKSSDADTAATQLVHAANKAGGDDNISVIVVRVGELPPPLPAAELPQEPVANDDDEGGSEDSGTRGAATFGTLTGNTPDNRTTTGFSAQFTGPSLEGPSTTIPGETLTAGAAVAERPAEQEPEQKAARHRLLIILLVAAVVVLGAAVVGLSLALSGSGGGGRSAAPGGEVAK